MHPFRSFHSLCKKRPSQSCPSVQSIITADPFLLTHFCKLYSMNIRIPLEH